MTKLTSKRRTDLSKSEFGLLSSSAQDKIDTKADRILGGIKHT